VVSKHPEGDGEENALIPFHEGFKSRLVPLKASRDEQVIISILRDIHATRRKVGGDVGFRHAACG
jgi:hypothetical protein